MPARAPGYRMTRLPTSCLALIFAAAFASVANGQGTRVVLLGTGTPNADPDHSGPAVAVVVNGASYLVDAGPGVVRRAAAAAARHQLPALTPPNLKTVFITHLHSDHTLGLPDLMFSPWVLDRTSPLQIYGPPRTARMTDLLSQAYADDIALRLTGGEPSNRTGYAIDAHDVLPGIVYRDSNVTVTAIAIDHGRWEHAYGYVFETADRRIVVSGDTRPSETIVDACNGCDVLVGVTTTRDSSARCASAFTVTSGAERISTSTDRSRRTSWTTAAVPTPARSLNAGSASATTEPTPSACVPDALAAAASPRSP